MVPDNKDADSIRHICVLAEHIKKALLGFAFTPFPLFRGKYGRMAVDLDLSVPKGNNPCFGLIFYLCLHFRRPPKIYNSRLFFTNPV